MKTPLQRLYRTKLALLATIITVVGFGLIVLAHWAVGQPDWLWLSDFPLLELGSTLFTTGLIVVAFEYIDRNDAEERALQRLREVMTEQAPFIRDTVIQGFAVEPATLAKVCFTGDARPGGAQLAFRPIGRRGAGTGRVRRPSGAGDPLR